MFVISLVISYFIIMFLSICYSFILMFFTLMIISLIFVLFIYFYGLFISLIMIFSFFVFMIRVKIVRDSFYVIIRFFFVYFFKLLECSLFDHIIFMLKLLVIEVICFFYLITSQQSHF
jgi:hypothetical protein